MKSIDLDTNKCIIVFSKEQDIADCVFLCKNQEFGGIRTTEICNNECPEMFCCELLTAMTKIANEAYKESE